MANGVNFLGDGEVDYIERCLILADGTKIYRYIPDCSECPDTEEYFTDEFGDKLLTAPDLTDAEGCKNKQVECIESQSWAYGIDNTGTTYDWTDATYEMTLSDGSVLTWEQTTASNGGWTDQLTEWAAGIQAAADAAGLSWTVEPRYVHNPNPNDISGSGSGLAGVPSEIISNYMVDNGIGYRFVYIEICPSNPTPTSATVISHSDSARFGGVYNNGGREGYTLIATPALLSPVNKFFVCRSCGEEPVWYLEDGVTKATAGQIPNCYEPCGTLSQLAPPPESDCNFQTLIGCDNNNSTNTVDFTNTITRRATVCNGEQIAVDYFQEDPDDNTALIAYELVGEFVDCATGDTIAIIDPRIISECTKSVICSNNKNYWQVKTIFTDGSVELSYEDELGIIEEPINWKIGSCNCSVIEYFELEGVTAGLRNREWHDTQPASPTTNTTTEIGRAFRESHDFSLTPDTDTIQSDLQINDTNNTASKLDIQTKEGYIIAKEKMLLRYAGGSEGYWAVELGQCCEEAELLAENGGFFPTREMLFTIPKGIHYVRIWNIDSGGSNSSATMGYSIDNGVTWVNDNTPPNISLSTTEPKQICKDGYICDGTYYESDGETPLVFSDTILKCEIECKSDLDNRTELCDGSLGYKIEVACCNNCTPTRFSRTYNGDNNILSSENIWTETGYDNLATDFGCTTGTDKRVYFQGAVYVDGKAYQWATTGLTIPTTENALKQEAITAMNQSVHGTGVSFRLVNGFIEARMPDVDLEYVIQKGLLDVNGEICWDSTYFIFRSLADGSIDGDAVGVPVSNPCDPLFNNTYNASDSSGAI